MHSQTLDASTTLLCLNGLKSSFSATAGVLLIGWVPKKGFGAIGSLWTSHITLYFVVASLLLMLGLNEDALAFNLVLDGVLPIVNSADKVATGPDSVSESSIIPHSHPLPLLWSKSCQESKRLAKHMWRPPRLDSGMDKRMESWVAKRGGCRLRGETWLGDEPDEKVVTALFDAQYYQFLYQKGRNLGVPDNLVISIIFIELLIEGGRYCILNHAITILLHHRSICPRW